MAGMNYKITLSAGAQMELSAGINTQVLPLLSQAVRGIASATAANWQSAVYKQRGIWSVEKDAYAASIKWKMTGDFSAYVEADYKYAYEIENGRPARDLKQMLNTSAKVRRTTKGKRFLVIPMRHNTPGNSALAPSMSPTIYDMASNMAASTVTSTGTRPAGQVTILSPTTGMHPAAKQSPFLSNPKTKQATMVASRQYQWGGRISAGMLKAAGLPKEDVKRYAGMVRMDTSTPGGAKSSAMMMFRIMHESSKGWIVPAKPGAKIAEGVAKDMQPKAEAAFSMAVKKTLGV